MSYSRARPTSHWVDYPDTTYGVITAATFDQWDQGIFDTKTRVFNIAEYGAIGDRTTDDTAAINAAIADYNSAGGGILMIPHAASDYFTTTGGHVITAPGTIMGVGGPQAWSGLGASALRLKNGSNQSMLTIKTQGVTVRDLSLYGNQANQSGTSHGILTSTASTTGLNYFKLVRLWIADFLTDGILIQTTTGSGSLGGSIMDVESRLNGRRGLTLASGSDCTITNSLFDQNGWSGIYVDTSATFSGIHCWGNGTNAGGTDLDGARINSGFTRWSNSYFETNNGNGAFCKGNNNIFVGCDFWSNRRNGIYAFSNQWSQWTGCTFRENGQASIAGVTSAGIQLDTCTACSVTACQMFDTKAVGFRHQTYGYAENGTTCAGCVFTANVSRATDHKTGNWLIGAGATPTIPSTPSSFNVG